MSADVEVSPPADTSSDYGDFGSDAEEVEILDQLIAEIEETPLLVTDIEDYEPPRGVLLPKPSSFEARSVATQTRSEPDSQTLREFIDTRREESREKEAEATPEPEHISEDVTNRSPLERFRKPPKKALSVTDLVSPSWCELQYFYTLSKHGRKRRTPAMKQGSAVHKALEDEVHTVVPIDVTKLEDTWGLRIWNICQGLRTLRETGRTRELEVWGTIGGEVVNGVIDELSYECPDPKYAEKLEAKAIPLAQLPEYQTSITEYLMARPKESEKSHDAEMSQQQDEKWIYLTDIKTRASPTLPTGSSLRPTILQLHLYHHMLENLAQGNFSLQNLADRYQLDVGEPFSDSFLAQLGSLNQEPGTSSGGEQRQSNIPTSTQDSMDILLEHNNLSSLWDFMMVQFRETFLRPPPQTQQHNKAQEQPPPPSQESVSQIPPSHPQPTQLSPLLTAEYLASNYQHLAGTKKKSLGRKSFQFNAAFLKSYLEENLKWWRGDRPAKGVELQEAWKCRSCDFRDDCEWIHERDNAAFTEAMERKKMREAAGVDAQATSRSRV